MLLPPPCPGRTWARGGESAPVMQIEETLPNASPLPTAGLAGQVSFAFYWAEHFTAARDWQIPPPERRPYATLWLISDGELQVEAEGSLCACGPGTLVAWPPRALRWAENTSGEPARLYTAAFNLHLSGHLDFFRLYQVPTCQQVETFEQLAQPFGALVDELAAYREAVTLEAEGWARVLVSRWLRGLEAARQLRPAKATDERLSAVLAEIDTELTDDWSLDRVAEMMRLSKVRAREVFVQGVGLPPMRYVTLRRVAQAKALLQDTDLTCAEISERCGYHDAAYFSRMFHRVAGMQPLAYREQTRFRGE